MAEGLLGWLFGCPAANISAMQHHLRTVCIVSINKKDETKANILGCVVAALCTPMHFVKLPEVV